MSGKVIKMTNNNYIGLITVRVISNASVELIARLKLQDVGLKLAKLRRFLKI